MDIAELDALFAKYRDAERRIGANLVDLDANPTLKMLLAGHPTGVTAQRIGGALAAAPTLWPDYDLLRATLSTAELARGQDKRPSPAARAEFERVLTAASVELGSGAVPMADRTLLGDTNTSSAITIDALIARMTATYAASCDAVAAVEAVWGTAVPRLNEARAALPVLEAAARELDVANEPTLVTLRDLMGDIDRQLGDDPLALASSSLDALPAALTLARTRLAEYRVARDSYEADRARAHKLLGTLAERVNDVRASYVRVRDRIVNPREVRDLSDDDVAAFRSLRGDGTSLFDDTNTAVHWRTRRVQLDSWLARAEAMRTRIEAAIAANEAPIRRRDELRGLLAALEAKAAARQRIEQSETVQRLRDARAVLDGAPCDLDRAASFVEALASDLTRKGV